MPKNIVYCGLQICLLLFCIFFDKCNKIIIQIYREFQYDIWTIKPALFTFGEIVSLFHLILAPFVILMRLFNVRFSG